MMSLLAAFSRLVPHPSNFTAIGAIAIFGGFMISNRYISILVPIITMWLSDIVLNNIIYPSVNFTWFSGGFAWIYAGILLHTAITFFFKKSSVTSVLITSISGAILFFVLSNFGVWISSNMYEHSLSGLLLCYSMALPFFGNLLAGNLVFSILLFGTYYILEKRYPVFQAA